MQEDKYKYLEKTENHKTRSYYIKKNKEAEIYLGKINQKKLDFMINDAIRISFRALPIETENATFWREFDAKNNKSKIYIKYKGEKEKIIIDINKAQNKEGYYDYYPSKQGNVIAYLTGQGGFETYNIYLIDSNGKKRTEKLKNVYEFLTWNSDETGFYYNKKTYISGDKRDYSSFKFEIYFHKLGTNQKQDTKLLTNKEKEFDNTAFVYMSISDNSKYIVIETEKSLIIKDSKTFKNIYISKYQNYDQYAFFREDTLYIRTNEHNEFGEIRGIKFNKDKTYTKETIIIKPQRFLLDDYHYTKSYIYCVYLKNLSHIIVIYNYKGEKVRTIKFQDKGTVYISGSYLSNDIYIYFNSFTTPYTIYKYIFDKDKLEKIYQSQTKDIFNPANYKTKYILVKNRENISVPVSIVYHKNTKLKTISPTLLKVYGGFGFNYSLPSYHSEVFPFLNDGGIYVLASIRGGGELGPKWHLVAKGSKGKMKTFQDFEDVTKFLIKEKYTNPEHLAITGVSHGGLVVTNAMIKNPAYYKCVIADVPETDAINSKKFGIGSLLTDEYGDPDNKEDYKEIIKWSPYQNIKDNLKYPDILILGALNDTRTGLFHALKFSKKLEEYFDNNVTLSVQMNTGHFGESNIQYKIQKQSYIFNYIYKELGMKT